MFMSVSESVSESDTLKLKDDKAKAQELHLRAFALCIIKQKKSFLLKMQRTRKRYRREWNIIRTCM